MKPNSTARKFSARSLWLIVPPALMALLDAGITLYGQSSAYWSGNYAAVSEASPSFAGYLAIHPLCFLTVIFVWIVIFSLIVLLLPETPGLCVSVAVLLGHMFGTSTWLLYNIRSYQLTMALILLTAVILVFAFKRGQSNDGSAAFDWNKTGLPSWSRWAVIVALIIAPIWWFFIPH